jgi:hypothetical protein
MGDIEKGVSQSSYLIRTYPLDWDNFRTRMAVCYGVRRAGVTPEAFASGGPLHHLQQEFCEWVSGRSQVRAIFPVLWCAVLCCAVLCCAVQCCAVLCCAVRSALCCGELLSLRMFRHRQRSLS